MRFNEKCGVFGIYSNSNDASKLAYYGLYALQHRGQENSGIAVSNGKRILCHKKSGLVAQVYNEDILKKLTGYIAVGHNRYSTFGKSYVDHSQPVYNNQNIVALAHNGNLPTVTKLKKFLKDKGIATHNFNDSEMMAKAIEYYLVKGFSLKDSITKCFPLFTGAFSLLVMTKKELAAVRDKHGIRPLVLGKFNHTYVFSSETCALDTIGAEFIREVEPGELVIVNNNGVNSYKIVNGKSSLDIFEFIYFARPDSHINGKNIYMVRRQLGIELAKQTKIQADVVIPVPDSAIPASIGFSEYSKIPVEHALTKNRYIHRTFIKPAQRQRTEGVSLKLNLIKELVEGKRVILIDDSIVRGTTSKKLIELVKLGKPKEIHLLITSPKVLYPDFYGIDTPNQKELIAANLNHNELTKFIGCDSVEFLDFDRTIKAIGIEEDSLCTSCFTGNYPINVGTKNKRNIKYFN